MTEAQEKILLETHGLTKEIYGSHKALIDTVKSNRVAIGANEAKIHSLETTTVKKGECEAIQGKEQDRRHWNWTRGAKITLIIFAFVNLVLGSGLILTAARLAALAP